MTEGSQTRDAIEHVRWLLRDIGNGPNMKLRIGSFAAVEVKGPGDQLSQAQVHALAALDQHSVPVYLWTPKGGLGPAHVPTDGRRSRAAASRRHPDLGRLILDNALSDGELVAKAVDRFPGRQSFGLGVELADVPRWRDMPRRG